MFGISPFEIISFLRQVGLALAGASCLWGIYFYVRERGAEKAPEKKVFKETSEKMIAPLTAGIFITALSWIFFEVFYPSIATAHEGISILPTIEQSRLAYQQMIPLLAGFLGVYSIGAIFRKINKDKFYQAIPYFYGVELILASIIISFPALTQTGSEQIFLAGHSFHSILTLGTVFILDFVFILTKYSDLFEKYLYPTLPTISKVIWLGLAIDFASVPFVFDQAVAHTPKFMLMQTVIAIVIINGAFLSGPLTKKLLSFVEGDNTKEPTPFWNKVMTISGSLSAASWITVTFVDLLHNIQIGYLSLLGIYAAFIASIYVAYEILEHYKIGSRW